MPFITDDELKSALSGLLKVQIHEMAHWEEAIGAANSAGYQEVVSALAKRGYTIAQINSWARGAEFQRHMGLFWALTEGGGLHNYDDKFINKLDRREELAEIAITDEDGNLLEPEGTSGNVGFGILSNQRERFILDDEDSRIDVPTRW